MPHLHIIRVVSNKTKANGLNRAKAASIPTNYHNLISGKYHVLGEKDPVVLLSARERYDADLAALVLADEPDIVVCAGWMHILTPKFLVPLDKRGVPVINLHPALPGMYDGAKAIERAYEDFQQGKLKDGETGIMIHFVISEVDRGQPIVVRRVKCRKGESLEELKKRFHGEEHEIIVEGTEMTIRELWRRRKEGKA